MVLTRPFCLLFGAMLKSKSGGLEDETPPTVFSQTAKTSIVINPPSASGYLLLSQGGHYLSLKFLALYL